MKRKAGNVQRKAGRKEGRVHTVDREGRKGKRRAGRKEGKGKEG